MADNITVSDSTTTNSKLPDSTVIATDDVSGVQFQKVKVDLGGDGASQVPDTNSGSKSAGTLRVVIATDQPALSNKLLVTPDLPSGASTSAKQDTIIGHVDGIETLLGTIDADTSTIAGAVSGTEMQVDVVTLPSIPAGTNNIGDVDIASIAAGDNNIGNVDVVTLPSLPAGTNNIGDVDVLTLPSLPAGTNAIGKLAANSGVDIGDVDVTSIPAVEGKAAASNGWLPASGSIGATKTNIGTANTPGQVGGWYIGNPNASAVYVQIFNAQASDVTLGTTAPTLSLMIPASSAANVAAGLVGIQFSTAISIAITTTRAGSTGPGATVDYNIFYKQ